MQLLQLMQTQRIHPKNHLIKLNTLPRLQRRFHRRGGVYPRPLGTGLGGSRLTIAFQPTNLKIHLVHQKYLLQLMQTLQTPLDLET
jgi:hypothetical protein